MTLSVQPAVALFDTARGEACGVAPVGVADPTFFAPITKVQREAGGVCGVVTNDAGEVIGRDGTPQGSGVLGSFGVDLPASFTLGGSRVLSGAPASVKDAPYRAVGDGATDDTAALQKALSAGGDIYIPEGTYITRPLFMVSDTVLYFHPSVSLKARTGYGTTDCLLNIRNVDNVTIFGNGAVIQMLKAEYPTGEWRHCVNIFGAANVHITKLVAKDSGGDGFYVGGPNPCDNVTLFDCSGLNNRRQGVSITNARNCLVLGGYYADTLGTAPACGIDVESNLTDGYYLQNINIIGVRTANNAGGGILVTPQSKYADVSIVVRECTSYYDGPDAGGVSVKAAMAYIPGTTPSPLIGKIGGGITVENCTVINPQGSGVVSVNWTENAPAALLKNIRVINPYSNPAISDTSRNKCGLLIRGETPSGGEYGTSTGNITIDGIAVTDSRAAPVMYSPVLFEPSDEASKPLKNISIRNLEVTAGQWTSGVASGVVRAGSLATTAVSVGYKSDFVVSSGSTSVPASFMGAVITNATSASYTLPVAANYIGTSFTFRVTNNSGILQISGSGADVIYGLSPDGGANIIGRYVGMELTVRAVAQYVWAVERATPGWAVKTYAPPRYPDSYAAAAPTTGAWQKQDKIFNNNPTSGSYIGWVCTVAGTPGTWAGFGLIA